jgi:putative signal transducing protein
MVAVLYVDNEIEAELARGLLANEGITAQVRFTARAGYPRYAAGAAVRAPLTTFEVLVPEGDAAEARRLLAALEPRSESIGLWRRWIMRAFAVVALSSLVAPLLIAAARQLGLLF